jgi:hypothetical protein
VDQASPQGRSEEYLDAEEHGLVGEEVAADCSGEEAEESEGFFVGLHGLGD